MGRESVRRRGTGALALALTALLALGACSDDAPAGPAEPTRSAADERADATILPQDGLPTGWVRVPPAQRLSGDPGKPVYCGVDVEPADVKEGRVSYYEQGGLPRSVLEYGMVATEESATERLDALLAVRDDCSEDGLDVTPVDTADLEGIGDQQVAWDFEGDDGMRFRALVFRRGEVVVTLVATGSTSVPTTEQLAIARDVDARLQG